MEVILHCFSWNKNYGGKSFKTSARNYFLTWFMLIKIILMEMGLDAKYLEILKKQLFSKNLLTRLSKVFWEYLKFRNALNFWLFKGWFYIID